MNERYPEGTPRPSIDQELWERASIVKKNYVKGQGQKRRPTISGTGSSATQSTQSSGHPAYHTPADCVRAICQNRDLLRILGGHLHSLSPDELAEAVAAAATSQHQGGDQVYISILLLSLSYLYVSLHCLLFSFSQVIAVSTHVTYMFYSFVNYRVLIWMIHEELDQSYMLDF